MERVRLDLGLLFLRLGGAGLLLAVHGLPKALHFRQQLGLIEDPLHLGAWPTLGFAVFAEVLCPLLIAQDAEGDDSKLNGACQLYGAIDHTGMGRKICGVKIKQMHAVRTRRPEPTYYAFHTVGATSGEHNILAWGYSPSDFSADIAAASQNQYASH